MKTAQQNDVVEGKHKHLLNTSRALKINVVLPKYFWGECILAATHIINKLPTANLSQKSPFGKPFSQPTQV